MVDFNRIRGDGRSNHWQDWVNLILAIWLFLSPWILQFATKAGPEASAAIGRADWNAWILGIVIALVAIAALTQLRIWQEWVNLILGIWVFIAPWVLGFATVAAAAWDHWIVGVLVFIFAVWDLQTIHRAPPTGAHAT